MRKMYLILLVSTLFVYSSCTTDDEPLCVAIPGTIDQNAINITFTSKVNGVAQKIEGLTKVVLLYDNLDKQLELSNYKAFNFSNWQTIPSLKIRNIRLEIDEKMYSIDILTKSVSRNLMLILNRNDNEISVELKKVEDVNCVFREVE